MIEISQLTKYYGKQCVIDSLSLSFTEGRSIALIGPNGSGKTTLIKCILGLAPFQKGEITIHGKNITAGPDYRETLGYMPQISRFPEQMKVSQLFRLIKKLRTDVAMNAYDLLLYEQFEINKFENKTLSSLSGGMKQQVSAALAFLFNPSIIILDEPTAGLDPVSNEILKEKINNCQKEGKLILVTSHILNDLEEICQEVVYLMDGKVQFNETIEALKIQTSEQRLNKMVIARLNQEHANVEN